MPQLLAIAEYITKTRAICMVCGNPANHTQRLVGEQRSRAARRAGHLRGALPSLLRSHAGGAEEQPPEGAGQSERRRSRVAMMVEQLARGARAEPARPGPAFLVVNLRASAGILAAGGAAARRRSCVWLPPQAAVLRPQPRHRRDARPPALRQGVPRAAGRPASGRSAS